MPKKRKPADGRRSLNRLDMLRRGLRTKRYGKDGGWTAWHPDYPYQWVAGVTEQDAIKTCMKDLKQHIGRMRDGGQR